MIEILMMIIPLIIAIGAAVFATRTLRAIRRGRPGAIFVRPAPAVDLRQVDARGTTPDERIAELERTVLDPPISATIIAAEQRAVSDWYREHPERLPRDRPPARPVEPPAARPILDELCDDCTWTTIYAGLSTIAVRRILTTPCRAHDDSRGSRPEPTLPDPCRPPEWR